MSWVLATVLGALPFIFSGTCRGPSIRVYEDNAPVLVAASRWKMWKTWEPMEVATVEKRLVLRAVANSTARGLTEKQLIRVTGLSTAPQVFRELEKIRPWNKWLVKPGEDSDAPRGSSVKLSLALGSHGAGRFDVRSPIRIQHNRGNRVVRSRRPVSCPSLHFVLAIEYALSRWPGNHCVVCRIAGTGFGWKSPHAYRDARSDSGQFECEDSTYGMVVCSHVRWSEHRVGHNPEIARHVGF